MKRRVLGKERKEESLSYNKKRERRAGCENRKLDAARMGNGANRSLLRPGGGFSAGGGEAASNKGGF